ncbi:MAG: radical SAM protein [archaeon]|nr:radical SAM protein [archaeon]
MGNIAFLNPPFFGSFNREVRFQSVSPQKALHPPIMLAYGTSVCREAGHKVDLIDAPAENMNTEHVIERFKKFSPEYIVMLTSTASVNSDGRIAQQLKQETGAKVVAVGSHASGIPEDTLRRGFDIVARGEYDYTVRDLADGMQLKDVKGISYLDGSNAIHNGEREKIMNLDELPFPARDFLPNKEYYSALYKNPFTFIYSGRGCPMRCSYCAPPQLLAGRMYRVRSVENVLEELKEIKYKYKLKSVLFNDDTLPANRKHLIDLCNLMIKEKLDFPWSCYSRVDTIDKQMAELMKRAGCHLVKVGFESGNDQILQNMQKGVAATTERAKFAAKTFREAGIQVHGTFVFGLPGENRETIKQTVEFAKNLNIDFVQFSIAQPYPGTEFYQYLTAHDYLVEKDFDKYVDEQGRIVPVFEYPDLKKDDLINALPYAYKQYYLRRAYILKAIKQRLTNWELMKNSWRSGTSLLKFIMTSGTNSNMS